MVGYRQIILTLVLLSGYFSISAQETRRGSAIEHFQAGLRLLKQERFNEALDAFKRSAELDPRRPETFRNIGATYLALKKPENAVSAFKTAIALNPLDATFHTAICEAWAASKDLTNAVAACREGVRLDPDSPDANEALISVMVTANRPDAELRQLIDSVVAKFSETVRILELAADHYDKVGENAYAAELYERLAALEPNSASHYARLADLYLRLERDVDAVAAARRCLSIDPSNAAAHYFMGKVFLELGLDDDAGDAFQKVIDTGRAPASASYYMAISQKRRGHHAAALSAITAAAARDAGNFSYQMELGSLLSSMARYEDAIAPLRRAVALRPRDRAALVSLGGSLFESANFADGISILEEANRLYPEDEVIKMFLGVARSRQESVAGISRLMERADKEPKNIGIRTQLVTILLYTRRLDEAERYAQEIWKLAPKHVKTFTFIAVAYSTAGKYDKALDAYKRALQIQEDGAAYLGFASIYGRRGMVEEASQAYRKVLEIKPDAPDVMVLFANHLRNSGKRREALEMYKNSLALKPINAPALYGAGSLSARLGDIGAAQQYLSELRNIDPDMAARLTRCLKLRLWN